MRLRRTMPLLTIGIYGADGLPLPPSHLEDPMTALRKPSSRQRPVTLGKLLLHRLENDQYFVDCWLGMHRGRRPIVAVRLRFVTWVPTGQPSRRFVWELCKWPKGESFEWMFVCWLLDEMGIWWKVFPSRRAAVAYFRQAPEVVMARRSSGHADGVEMRAS